jgi:hypothetical protein
MTVHAYVLIQTEVGKAAQVARQLSRLRASSWPRTSPGPYDVIARAEAAPSTSSVAWWSAMCS